MTTQHINFRTRLLEPYVPAILRTGTRPAVSSPRSGRVFTSRSEGSRTSRSRAVRLETDQIEILETDEFELLDQVFQRTAFKGPTEGAISDAMKGAYDHTANTGGTYRSVVDSWSSFESAPPIHDNFLRPMLGMTTAGYFPVAVLGLLKAHEKVQLAQRIGDEEGVRLAELEMSAKITTALGGACFIAARPLTMAAGAAGVSASGFNASSSLGKATYTMNTIGSWLFGATALISGIRGGIGLYNVRKFDQKLKACTSDAEKIALLQSSVHTDANDVYKTLKAKYEKKFSGYKGKDKNLKIIRAVKDELVKEAISKGAEEMHAMLVELSKEPGSTVKVLSVKECQKLIDQMKDRQLEHLPQNQAQQMLRNALCKQGLSVMVSKLQMKKEMEMSRILTPECVKLIKEKQDSKLILEKVDEAIYSNKMTHKLNILIALLGVLTTIGAIFITGGGLFIALGILSIIYNVGGFMLDGRGFIKALESGTPGRHDKVFLLINVTISVVCFALGLFLMCFFGQFALLPFLFALLILLTWVGAHGYAWKRVNENMEKRKAENPTVAYFVESLKQERNREKLRALFYKLPKGERNDFERHLLLHHPNNQDFTHQDLIDGAEAYLHHVDEVEKDKKLQLMLALQPVVGRFLAQQRASA